MGGVGSGAKPREYPAHLVEEACWAYAYAGMTVREVGEYVGPGVKVQNVLERYLGNRRPRAKRDQQGPRNHMWRHYAAGYQAMHLRVRSQRGAPGPCEYGCDGPTEWANVSGHYSDVMDYMALCRSCHRHLDSARRRWIGRGTREVMPNA